MMANDMHFKITVKYKVDVDGNKKKKDYNSN